MKLGLFSDPHYSCAVNPVSSRKSSDSLRKIKEAYDFFEEKHCDLVICLGDLTDNDISHEKEIENLKSISSVFHASSLPTLCMMGNHDAFTFEVKEFYDIVGKDVYPENQTIQNHRFLFMDACFFSDGHHYLPGDSGWTDTFFPCLPSFEKTLQSGNEDTYIFIHQNLDPAVPASHRLSNACEIRNVLKKYPCVKTVYQGHYHEGHDYTENHIRYVTLPAMCERENAYFVIDLP